MFDEQQAKNEQSENISLSKSLEHRMTVKRFNRVFKIYPKFQVLFLSLF